MPLTRLFQKHGSQKNKISKIQSKESNSERTTDSESVLLSQSDVLSKEVNSEKTVAPDSVPSTQSDIFEINELLQELITKTVNMELSSNKAEAPVLPNFPITDCIEINKNHISNCKSNSVETNDDENILKQDMNSKFPKQKRSVSESHFEVSSSIQPKGQRKFGSESNVLAVGEKLIPPKQRKEIDDVISKYVDKMIRDSIVKAVNNVDVDSLYKEILKDYSNRRGSESVDSVDDFVVEQRLSSHSISELVELESRDEFSYMDKNSNSQDCNNKLNEPILNELVDVDHETFKGYLADYEDTTSVDDLKSVDEDSSICSMSDGLKNQFSVNNENFSKNSSKNSFNEQDDVSRTSSEGNTKENNDASCLGKNNIVNESVSSKVLNEQSQETHSNCQTEHKTSSINSTSEDGEHFPSEQPANKHVKENLPKYQSTENLRQEEEQSPNVQNCSDHGKKSPAVAKHNEQEQESHSAEESNGQKQEQLSKDQKVTSSECMEDLIVMTPSDDFLSADNIKCSESDNPTPDVDENIPQQQNSMDEERKVNWKVGYLHVKLPHKSRGKTHLKAWKKRCVAIQPDEFVNDPKNPSLVVSVYGAESRKHKATFWQTVSSQRAVVYRSSSKTHRYAFTISDEGRAIIHLSAESETTTQEWMAAIRAVLWPPSPFMQLEKMLSGREFEISLIDNEFSYHAGLLGMYGYLTITPRKLTLLHPQQGYVIQEWYLNTVDKFQLVPQPKVEDAHKVLAMTTCSDSSTGKGEILLYCSEAVTLLQSLASTIHQVLSLRSKEDGGGNRYQKELEEMAEWLVSPPQDSLDMDAKSEDHYKVPTRQVKSLLDIPNFIFEKSLSPVASAIYPAPSADILEPLETARAKPTTTSQDSGISTCHSGDDFLNCSITSFVVGGGPMTGKSSDSEMSDTYTPPRSPERLKKSMSEKKSNENLSIPKA